MSNAVPGDYDLDYNLWWGNAANVRYGVPGDHAVFSDPMFVSAPVKHNEQPYDVHLQAFSRAIDAGDPSILDTDGSRSDIGAFGGPGGETYFYRDLPPAIPGELSASVADSASGVELRWSENSASDFKMFRLYRGESVNVIPTAEYLLTEISGNTYTDTDVIINATYYYIVTAVDSSGNESNASDKVSVLLTGVETKIQPVEEYRLEQNYPNPFNPGTKIGFRLRERGKVNLGIYTITGEKVIGLVNQEMPKGYHETEFNGEGLSSGIYLYKIEAKDGRGITVYSESRKMLLLK